MLNSQHTIVPVSGKLPIFVDPLAYLKFGENLEKVCKNCDGNWMEFSEKIMWKFVNDQTQTGPRGSNDFQDRKNPKKN